MVLCDLSGAANCARVSMLKFFALPCRLTSSAGNGIRAPCRAIAVVADDTFRNPRRVLGLRPIERKGPEIRCLFKLGMSTERMK